VIQIYRTDFAALSSAHADGVKAWIEKRLEFAEAAYAFVGGSADIEDTWFAEPLPISAKCMADFVPAVGADRKQITYATPDRVKKTFADAQSACPTFITDGSATEAVDWMRDHLADILQARPTALVSLNKRFKSSFATEKDSLAAGLARWVFDYDEWVNDKGESVSWTPGELVRRLNIRTCPYCNRQYVFAEEDESGKIHRPDIDHFFSQTDYPLLRMSFFNLVPACDPCNGSDGKGATEFSLEEYLHPFEDGFGDECVFHISSNIESADPLAWIESPESLPLDLDNRVAENAEKHIKIENHKEVFNLVALYSGHRDEVADIVRDYTFYTDLRVSTMNADVPGLDLSMETAERILWGSSLSLQTLDERILSKLRRDIVNQLRTIGGTE